MQSYNPIELAKADTWYVYELYQGGFFIYKDGTFYHSDAKKCIGDEWKNVEGLIVEEMRRKWKPEYGTLYGKLYSDTKQGVIYDLVGLDNTTTYAERLERIKAKWMPHGMGGNGAMRVAHVAMVKDKIIQETIDCLYEYSISTPQVEGLVIQNDQGTQMLRNLWDTMTGEVIGYFQVELNDPSPLVVCKIVGGIEVRLTSVGEIPKMGSQVVFRYRGKDDKGIPLSAEMVPKKKRELPASLKRTREQKAPSPEPEETVPVVTTKKAKTDAVKKPDRTDLGVKPYTMKLPKGVKGYTLAGLVRSGGQTIPKGKAIYIQPSTGLPRGEYYKISHDAKTGDISCTCPAYLYHKKERNGKRVCKHILAAIP